MNLKKIFLFLLVFLFLFNNVSAFENDEDLQDDEIENNSPQNNLKSNNSFLNITNREIEAFLRAEYNRSGIFYGEMSILGSVDFFNLLKLKSGVSIGRTRDSTDLNALFCAGYAPFSKIPLDFSLSWIYNGIPEFDTNVHSLLPLISFSTQRAGISAGIAFRFTSFFGEKPYLEYILSFLGYINIVNADSLQIGISIGTLNDFNAKNTGAFSLKVNIDIYIDKNWSILNELELLQTGSANLAVNFYGFAWRGGLRYSW